MKKIILIAVLIISTFSVTAQTIKASEQYFDFNDVNNIYFKDINNHYDKFLGEWEVTNGLHYLKIIITKTPRVEQGLTTSGRRAMTFRRYIDIINIDYIYKYNNVTIYNIIKPYQVDIDNNKISSNIFGHILKNSNQTIDLFYDEPSATCGRNKNGRLNLSFINSSTPQLQWNRTDNLLQIPESLCPESEIDTSIYRIPSSLILTKL